MRLIFLILLICSTVTAEEYGFNKDDIGIFGGYVSKVFPEIGIFRVRFEFKNKKFLNKGDVVEFWHGANIRRRCKGFVLVKSNKYVVIEAKNFSACRKSVFVTVGGHLNFRSEDFRQNLIVANELLQILVKKRIATQSRLNSMKKELHSYIEKMEAVNSRYKVLRDKLNLEWENELRNIEEDKVTALNEFKELELSLGDIDHKLEKYRISDKNFDIDRWALDSKLYIKE